MHLKHLAAGFVAVAALALASPGKAGDTIKLKLPVKPAGDLFDLKATDADLHTETIDTRRYYGGGGFYGGGRGGFYGGRGYGGGFYGGYGRGYYGGYRGGFYGGYGRGYYGGYRGGYWGGYGRGFYAGVGGFYGGYRGFYPGYYGYSYLPSYYSYSAFTPGFYNYAYAYPCSLETLAPPAALTVRVGPAYSLRPAPVAPVLPLPREDKGSGTFPYDGGPQSPVPMPRTEEGKVNEPRNRPATIDDVLVSTAPQDVSGTGKWAYPAYGETPRRAAPKASTGFQLVVYGRPAK